MASMCTGSPVTLVVDGESAMTPFLVIAYPAFLAMDIINNGRL
jgi:hypothetical protein